MRHKKLKQTHVYFLGRPDQLHFISSMMNVKNQFKIVEKPDHADLFIVENGMEKTLEQSMTYIPSTVIKLSPTRDQQKVEILKLMESWSAGDKRKLPSAKD